MTTRRVRAGLAARHARAVVHAELGDPRAGERGAGDELGADHRAVGREAQALGEVARGSA